MKVAGFKAKTHTVYYLDLCGKDPRTDINRWRIHAYYEPNYAETLFFDLKDGYDSFIKKHEKDVYKSFNEFCKDYKTKLVDITKELNV